jgi:hypothetical protein
MTSNTVASLEVFIALLATDTSLYYPYGEPASKLAVWFKIASVPEIPIGNYPVICNRCAAKLGDSAIRAMLVSNVRHKGCYTNRNNLVFNQANIGIVAKALGIDIHTFEHFAVMEEYNRRLNKEQEIENLSRYATNRTSIAGLELVSSLSC